ncbi:MAG: InlB B-repeat-containing protein [Bryobacteraceae bacterium]
MNRASITLVSVFFIAIGVASGQTTQTRIYSDPPGASFYVDGTKYTSSATFFWPKGSRHTVSANIAQDTGGTTRMGFQGWTDDKSLLQPTASPSITVTADPDFLTLKGTFIVEHRIDVHFTNAVSSAPVDCAAGLTAPGVIYIDGQCVTKSVAIWAAKDATIIFNAFPARGFVFEGWIVNGAPLPDSFLRTYKVSGPSFISPRFAPAKRVIFRTEPEGLNIMVDRTLIPTGHPTDNLPFVVPPWELDFADGSSHVLGAPATQYDRMGKTWILDSFSIGGGEGAVYKTVGVNTPETVLARFIRGTGVSFLTNPLGLKLNVDGRESWPSYNFVWGVGTKHTVTAPSETTDAKGRKYRFLGWASGGEATQQITTLEETELGGMRLVANYELYPRLVISSGQPGSRLQVDGAFCPLPCTLDRPNGTTVGLSVPENVSLGADSRLQFEGWSDTAAATRTVTFAGADRQLSFRYRTYNRLLALSDPAEGASFRVEPGSADGFYPNDATVQVTAVAAESYKFRRWEGDLSGTGAAGFLSMLAPRLVRAQLDKVPYIPSAGIRNAAADTPLKAVAPGSIVSIFGSGLANDYVAGANAPLAQTLGNVTARIGTRLLPLLFVSPEQVNAYLPSDLADGEYTLAVRNGGLPEISGKVTVVRHAPGIFGQLIGERFVATVQRPDGSLAAPDRPAKRGEQVMLMGTGFGAYQRGILDGFPAADNPPNPLGTKPEILVGDLVYTPDFAGAAPGLAGITVIRFTVPAEWNAGTVELRIRQAGVESNNVLLPVE